MTATPYEVLTMGRVGVDVYPDQVGVGLDEVETFHSYVGQSDQRRGRRRQTRPPHRDDHQGGRGPVRTPGPARVRPLRR